MRSIARFIAAAGLGALAVAAAAQIRDPLETGLRMDTQRPAPVVWDDYSYGADPKDKIRRIASRVPGRPAVVVSLDDHDAFEYDDRYDTEWLHSFLVDQGFAYSAVFPRFGANKSGPAHAAKLAQGVAEIVSRAEKYGYDGSRLILLGKGWGGQTAALLGTDPSWLESAGVNFASVRGVIILDGAGFDIPAEQGGAKGKLREQIGKLVGGDENAAQALSPIHHVTAPNAPSFLFHVVTKDQRLMAQTNAFAAALQAAGTDAQVKPVAHSRWSSLSTFIGHPSHKETAPLLQFLKEATR